MYMHTFRSLSYLHLELSLGAHPTSFHAPFTGKLLLTFTLTFISTAAYKQKI